MLVFLLLVFEDNVVHGQQRQIGTVDESLVRKLINSSLEEQERLLKNHAEWLSPDIWQRLTDHAFHAHRLQRNLDNSRRIYILALKVAGLIGSDPLIAQTYYKLGKLHSLYDLTKAIEYYSHSYNKFLQLSYWSDLIYICADLANLYFKKDELERAKMYVEESIKYNDLAQADTPSTKVWPLEYGVAWALVTKAYIAYQEGETINAIQYGIQAISLYQELDRKKVYLPYEFTAALSIIGECYMRTAEYREAQKYYNRSARGGARKRGKNQGSQRS